MQCAALASSSKCLAGQQLRGASNGSRTCMKARNTYQVGTREPALGGGREGGAALSQPSQPAALQPCLCGAAAAMCDSAAPRRRGGHPSRRRRNGRLQGLAGQGQGRSGAPGVAPPRTSQLAAAAVDAAGASAHAGSSRQRARRQLDRRPLTPPSALLPSPARRSRLWWATTSRRTMRSSASAAR